MRTARDAGLGMDALLGRAGRVPDRSSSLALARSCMPAASLLVKVGEPGDAEKVAAWARACEACWEGGFFFYVTKNDEKKSLCKMTNMVLWTPLASVLLAISL